MRKVKDITGQRFGKLTPIRPTPQRRNGSAIWECRCDCGNTVHVTSGCLQSGSTKSCGCLRKERGIFFGKDLTGQRFGRLTAIRPTPERRSSYVVWECRCDCGNVVYVNTRNLKSGNTKSCGCGRRLRLEGKRFGKLVVVGKTEERKNNMATWECRCDCGKTVFVRGNSLTEGNTRSCGCLKKENKGRKVKDLSGLRFGRLTAIRATKQRKGCNVIWECKCDCGNTTFVRSGSLLNGRSRSCGCTHKKRNTVDLQTGSTPENQED